MLASTVERLGIGQRNATSIFVRYMDTDKIEGELENKFAARDIASVETPDEAEPPVSVEDFVSCSR